MEDRTKIEVFSAGCPLCDNAVKVVRSVAGEARDVVVRSTKEEVGEARARELGVRSVPAVAVDGRLLSCCEEQSIDGEILRTHLAERRGAPDTGRTDRSCC